MKSYKYYDSLYVIDIDNTLTISELGQPINHINPKPRISLINYINKIKNEGKTVIYLSARNFELCNETFYWLQSHNLIDSKKELFLVKSAISKIPYLKFWTKYNNEVIYIDDLSYNHEKGEIKLYDQVIFEVNSMSIKYNGLVYIDAFS